MGCLAESKGCNVLFRLDYENKQGKVKNLGSWRETFDGQVTILDLDLSSLKGQQVRFILTVENRGDNPARANAFWFVPRVVQEPLLKASPTATLKHTPSPTAATTATGTATETPTPTSTPTLTPTSSDTPTSN
jgi:hypothetical protein